MGIWVMNAMLRDGLNAGLLGDGLNAGHLGGGINAEYLGDGLNAWHLGVEATGAGKDAGSPSYPWAAGTLGWLKVGHLT